MKKVKIKQKISKERIIFFEKVFFNVLLFLFIFLNLYKKYSSKKQSKNKNIKAIQQE